jgi:hypothetical protein
VVLEVGPIALIAYTPWGNALIGTAPIGGEVWLFVLPFVIGLLALEEVRKWIVRRTGGHDRTMTGAGD